MLLHTVVELLHPVDVANSGGRDGGSKSGLDGNGVVVISRALAASLLSNGAGTHEGLGRA